MKNYFPYPILFCILFMIFIITKANAQFAGGNGSAGNPYQITNADELYAIDNYTGSTYAGTYFQLMNNIDLSTWISTNTDPIIQTIGWKPIGSNGSTFQGYFHGSGFSITGLWINRVGYIDDDYVGLFSYLENGTIDSLNVEIDSIQGIAADDNIGGLVGFNKGTISNCHVSGKITGDEWVGGLSGVNMNGTIQNSSATISINGRTSVGGLVGDNKGSLLNSYAIGSIRGINNTDNNDIGGLVGYNESLVNGCYAAVNATGGINDYLGGLIGENNGTITNSYATGEVSGGTTIGGLVGINSDTITNSHATGNVIGNDQVGGLVGENNGQLDSCFATGSVGGNNLVGGLVGNNEHVFSDCFATGSVIGVQKVGGLTGYNNFPVNNSYATGYITGIKYVGGLVGMNNDRLTNCYAMGNISGNEDIGGLTGINYYPINNCYATGSVTGDSFVGGLTGENYGSNSSISNSLAANSQISGTTQIHRIEGANDVLSTSTNNYALNSMIVVIDSVITNVTSTDSTSLDGSDIISGNLQATSTYTGTFFNWNLSTHPIVWNIWQGNSFPFFSWQSAPIKITSGNNRLFASISRTGFVLDSIVVYKMQTISGIQQFTHLNTITSGTSETNWTPILQTSNVFVGDTLYFLSYEQGKKASYPVLARLSQKETTWLTNGIDSDWNNSGNWSDGVPGTGAFVIVSGGANYYPELQVSTNAVCDTIQFKAGSEVAKTNLLTYNAAKVDLALSANQWYMVAPALRNMYSGDYWLDESTKRLNPAVYFQAYQTVNPQTGKPAGSGEWSNPINKVLTSLDLGMAYAIKVDNGASDSSPFIFHFPKDSTTYSYYDWNGNYTFQESGMTRINNNRFIYEIGSGTPDDPSRAPANNAFSVTVTADHDSASNIYATTIVGNPFMSHLDFIAFYNENQSKISNSYHIWGMNGTSFESTINIDGTLISTDDDDAYIPPMQSFIVNKIDTAALLGALDFTENMSVTRPASSLRSSQQRTNILKLSISRTGKRQSGIALYFKEGESNNYNATKDVWTFFAEKTSEMPVLYTLLNGNPSSIHTFGSFSKPIELGIRTTQKGILSLEMTGLDSFGSDLDVYLEDRETQTSQNLRISPEYSFQNTTGNVEGRFFLKFVSNTDTLIKDTQSDGISIHMSKGEVHISSDINDPLKQIDVFDVQGRVLISKSGLHTSSIAFEMPDSERIYIVKIQTEKNVTTKKIQSN